MQRIEVIGRILLRSENHLLLTKKVDRSYTFLPGGHVEFNEETKTAILRELKEEFNGRANINEFVGVLECSFDQDARRHHELNFLFSGELLNYRYPAPPEPREPHLKFLWQPINDLKNVNLLPPPIIPLIHNYYAHGGKGIWRSGMEK